MKQVLSYLANRNSKWHSSYKCLAILHTSIPSDPAVSSAFGILSQRYTDQKKKKKVFEERKLVAMQSFITSKGNLMSSNEELVA